MNQQNHVGDCNVEGIVRKGTKLGSRHMRLGLNNQDAVLSEEFYIPSTKKNYYVGLVSDGCTGFPFFSNTEVGSRLLSVFAYDRIQQFLCSGIEMCDVPRVLYGACAQYLQSLTALTLSHSTIWKYPVEHKVLDGRTAQDRLQSDYFAATLMGFISDGNEMIIFTAGDGLVLLNEQITVIDQNDHPEYIINYPVIV